jgi:hypothetical protein
MLSRHQKELLSLVEEHGPVFVHSSRQMPPLPFPRFVRGRGLEANLLAIEALEWKKLVRRLPDARLVMA